LKKYWHPFILEPGVTFLFVLVLTSIEQYIYISHIATVPALSKL